jgi:hypothetical protein
LRVEVFSRTVGVPAISESCFVRAEPTLHRVSKDEELEDLAVVEKERLSPKESRKRVREAIAEKYTNAA